jgi:release factor glutamine methyltransferase
MQISNWQKEAVKILLNYSITSAALDAEVLLSFVLKKPREYLLAHPEIFLTQEQKKELNKLIARRAKSEPVAYITNNKEFYGLDFYVDQNVLIPRPETELLVDEVISRTTIGNKTTIADIGTGSGCIAVAMAKNLPDVKIIATDISESALNIAKKNAKIHGVDKQIRFFQRNLLENISDQFDFIIANLPYLPASEMKKEIAYEPKLALFADNDGLELLEIIIKQSMYRLKPHGIIILEIHPPQAETIRNSAEFQFPEAKVELRKDLANKERILMIKS